MEQEIVGSNPTPAARFDQNRKQRNLRLNKKGVIQLFWNKIMRETRVNLKHLLEDIRDSYPMPIEEAIITELVANALDSKASQIEFFVNSVEGKFTIRDNGQGMKRKELRDYHDIATTTKIKGKGIGFAGIGAKLSLLVTNSVITETKGGYGSHSATQWYLMSENRAPWKFIAPPGQILTPRGTAITLEVSDPNSPLLQTDFISKTIKKHYYPLFFPQFLESILRCIYKKGVHFFINGQKISLDKAEIPQNFKVLNLHLGRTRKLAGFGFLGWGQNPFPSELIGVGISTYGKVIKRGWDWLGIWPQSISQICGLVEAPALSEILTTNKNDFLRDSTSLKRYYQYRKAIQETILPILDEWGERSQFFENDLNRLRPLEKSIEKTLRILLNHFPELIPLVGIRKANLKEGLEGKDQLVGIIPKEKILQRGEKIIKEEKGDQEKIEKKEKKSTPALNIGFEENPSLTELARMVKNTIWINTTHPAYNKAKKEKSEEYHLLLSVAWLLSKFIDENRSPQSFISEFLATWAGEKKIALQIFEKENLLRKTNTEII